MYQLNYIQPAYNRKKKIQLNDMVMLYLQSICNFTERIHFDEEDYYNTYYKELTDDEMDDEMLDFNPSKSKFMKLVCDDICYLFNDLSDDVEALKAFNEKAYELLKDTFTDISNPEKDYELIYRDLIKLRKELAKTNFIVPKKEYTVYSNGYQIMYNSKE